MEMQSKAHACENIVHFLGVTKEPQSNYYCIVMEYTDSGNLQEYLEKNFSSLNWNQKYQLALDITNGLRYLHKEHFLHRDLHAKNIVIQKGKAKITGFENSKSVLTLASPHKVTFGIVPYMAPELIEYDDDFQPPPFSEKSDVYSLGVLLWELSSGCPPFVNNTEFGSELIFKIINGEREKKVPNIPPDYYHLYTSCWKENPNERPIVEVVYHELRNMLPKNNEMQYENAYFTKDFTGNQCPVT